MKQRVNDTGGMQGTVLLSITGPTPIVRTCQTPRLPEAHLHLLSVPAYVLGLLWAVAMIVWRAEPLAGTRAGSEFLRFARPTVSAAAVDFSSVWPDVPGLSFAGQVALLVALGCSIGLALVARLTQGRAYLVLLGLAASGAAALAVAALSLLTSEVPLSDTAAGLMIQIGLLAALCTGAWRLQRRMVVADIDSDTSITARPVPRVVDRVASGVFFIYLMSIIGPVWIGRKLLGDELEATARVAPTSVAAKLFNGASPWFFGYGAALGAVLYAAVLLIPPYIRRGRLVVLGCVLGVLAVGPGLTTIGEQARAASTSVANQVRVTAPTGDQLGWICGSWASTAQPGLLTVFEGDGCRTLATYQGQLRIAELSLRHDFYNDAAVTSAGSNALNGGTGFLAGTYDQLVIAVADSPSSAGGHVLIAQDMTTATEAWTFTCPVGSSSYAVRFSGSGDGDEPSVNRETIELFGLLEYVAVGCGSGGDYIIRTDGTIVGQ